MKLRKVFTCILLMLMVLILSIASGCGKEIIDELPNQTAEIPAEYTEVIADYQRIVAFRLSENFEKNYESGITAALKGHWTEKIPQYDQTAGLSYRWRSMLVDMLDYVETPTMASFGYILADVNQDGTSELFWVDANYRILAVFTSVNDQAVLIDAYWPHYQCIVLQQGLLLTQASVSASDCVYTVAEVDPDEETLLRTVKRFGTDSGMCFEENADVNRELSEKEYGELLVLYPFAISREWKANRIHFLTE